MSDGPIRDDEVLARISVDVPGIIPLEDGPVIGLDADDTLDRHTRRDLQKEERVIAMKYHGGRSWVYAAVTVVCFAVWLSFFPLAIMGKLNLPFACVFSTIIAAYGFIPSHEAMHSNIYPRGHRLYWINEMTGHLSTIPIALGFGVARLTHMEHHKYTNDVELDPDYTDGAPNAFRAIIKTWWNRQPGVEGSVVRYKRVLQDMDTPGSRKAVKQTTVLQLSMMATFFSMAWAGYAIEVALIWWLPRQIGLSWIRYWLSWAPHHPQNKGRYENTRIFKTWLGHWGSMGMQFHMIHHLYPGIPNHLTKPAYFAMKDVLRRQGVDVSAH